MTKKYAKPANNEPSEGVMLGRLYNGMFVVGRKVGVVWKDVYVLGNIVSEGTKVSVDINSLMHPVSGVKASINEKDIISAVVVPEWILIKYRELVSGIMVTSQMPEVGKVPKPGKLLVN